MLPVCDLVRLSHVLITDGLERSFGNFQYTHFDNDCFRRESIADGHHLSEHDPPVVNLIADACPEGDDRSTVLVADVDNGVNQLRHRGRLHRQRCHP
jgi:hypothetical protein